MSDFPELNTFTVCVWWMYVVAARIDHDITADGSLVFSFDLSQVGVHSA